MEMVTKDRLTMPVREYAKYSGIGINQIYAYTKRKDFPCLKVGRKLLVVTAKADEWLLQNLTTGHE